MPDALTADDRRALVEAARLVAGSDERRADVLRRHIIPGATNPAYVSGKTDEAERAEARAALLRSAAAKLRAGGEGRDGGTTA